MEKLTLFYVRNRAFYKALFDLQLRNIDILSVKSRDIDHISVTMLISKEDTFWLGAYYHCFFNSI